LICQDIKAINFDLIKLKIRLSLKIQNRILRESTTSKVSLAVPIGVAESYWSCTLVVDQSCASFGILAIFLFESLFLFVFAVIWTSELLPLSKWCIEFSTVFRPLIEESITLHGLVPFYGENFRMWTGCLSALPIGWEIALLLSLMIFIGILFWSSLSYIHFFNI